MSESLKRELEETADQLTEAMDVWQKANRYRESLAVALADSLLVYGEDVSGVELYRQAKESEEAKRAFLGLVQADALKVAQAWRDYKRTAEIKEPSPAATGEGEETNPHGK